MQTAKPVKHTPLTFYLRTLLYMFVGLFLRILALAPLACLFLFPEDSPLRFLALLCPILLVFLVLPLRFSFADALVHHRRTRYFSFDTALSTRRYGEKLGEGLLYLLSVAKWALPLLAMLGYGYWLAFMADAGLSLSTLVGLGKTSTGIAVGVINFFRNLFGHLSLPETTGGMMEGLYTLGGILGLGVLILLFGIMRNSAYRYIWAMASHDNLNFRGEMRRHLRGRRFTQLLVALLNLLLLAPFLYVVGASLVTVLSDLSTAAMNFLATRKLSLPDFTGALAPLLLAFYGLYMPLLPLRRYFTAFFATKKVATPEEVPAPVQTAGYVPVYSQPASAPAATVPVPVFQPAPSYTPPASTPVEDAPFFAKVNEQAAAANTFEPSVQNEEASTGNSKTIDATDSASPSNPASFDFSDSSSEDSHSFFSADAHHTEASTGADDVSINDGYTTDEATEVAPEKREDVDPPAFTIGQ